MVLAGCLQNVSSSKTYTDNYAVNLKALAISDPEELQNCNLGSCQCMVCKNSTSLFDFFTSMVGGTCFFQENCTQDVFDSLNSGEYSPEGSSDKGYFIRPFMLGAGPNFADFGDANGYCNNRMSMAVQFLVGDEETPYDKPDAGRAICYMDKGVMPVYALYSGGKNIDAARSEEIGHILATQGSYFTDLTTGPVGPVVVTTEMDFNESHVPQVIEQVRSINQGCLNDRAAGKINCMVAVAPEMGNTAALKAVMDVVGDQVDLVAFGINGHLADIEACSSPGADLLSQARDFASTATYNFSKPSIIPYVLFDAGGTDRGGTCKWSEAKMIQAYSQFFPSGVTTLQKKGVIGVAPYAFNSTSFGVSNPLGCVDCALGASEARLRSWYGGCQAYTAIAKTSPTGSSQPDFPTVGTLNVFPSQEGAYCDYNSDQSYILRNLQFGYSLYNKDFYAPQPTALTDSDTSSLFRCDACLTQSLEIPYPQFAAAPISPDHKFCTAFPELDYWAARRNLDPMFVRAIAATESGFDPCAAARVCAGGDIVGQCDAGFEYMVDPRKENGEDGYCDFEKESDDGRTPQLRYNGLGLMQTIIAPSTFWNGTYTADGEDGIHASIQNSKLTPPGFYPVALQCNPAFNPFNVSDNACLGTWILAGTIASARGWLENNPGIASGGGDAYNAMVGYIASHKYYGDWDGDNYASADPTCQGTAYSGHNGNCWAYGYAQNKIYNEEFCQEAEDQGKDLEECDGAKPNYKDCYGMQDFLDYVGCRIANKQGGASGTVGDVGISKMRMYYSLREGCSTSFCPDWRQLEAKTGGWLAEKHPGVTDPYHQNAQPQ